MLCDNENNSEDVRSGTKKEKPKQRTPCKDAKNSKFERLSTDRSEVLRGKWINGSGNFLEMLVFQSIACRQKKFNVFSVVHMKMRAPNNRK